MEEDKIKYSDIIQPDDSIERLITQLEGVSQSYESMVGAIKAGADKLASALKSTSGATAEGRKTIDEAAEAASRLERAEKELAFALSDTGKEVAWLKAQTRDVNKTTVEQQRYVKQAVTSYNRLKADLKQTVELYKALTEAERADSEMGKKLIEDILNLKNQIKALDTQMKPHIQALSEVEKAEQKLNFLLSEEGQQYLKIKAQISELTNARKQHKAVIDPLTQAQEKLAKAQSWENEQLKMYSIKTKEANRMAELRARIAASEEGSYNRLAAQYELNKIKLNQMSDAERNATAAGKQLEKETLALYVRMTKLQEATGNYRLSVGQYQNAWNGLGFSVSQVVRELPSAAVSLNTFFLAISNNIPMVIDDIRRLRLENINLAKEGKPTVKISKQIAGALISWNTGLVLVLTALTIFGDEIVDWIKKVVKGRDAVISTREALKNVAKEIKDTNGSYGDNVVTLKKLSGEYKNLKTEAEKKQWIEDNESKFTSLGVAINDVADADLVFISNTPDVIKALMLRAKATAAQKLATEKYEEALIKQNEADTTLPSVTQAVLINTLPGVSLQQGISAAASLAEKRKENLETEAEAAEKTADSYFKLSQEFLANADALLAGLGLSDKVTSELNKEKEGQRDLTDAIQRMKLSVEKKYAESRTALIREEYAQREQSAKDAAAAEIAQLEEQKRKNEDYLNDTEHKYKELSVEEKAIIEQANKDIEATIVNTTKQLDFQLKQLALEREISEIEILKNGLDLRLKTVAEGSKEELAIKLEQLEKEREIALLRNELLPAEQQLDTAYINKAYDSMKQQLKTDFLTKDFELQQQLEEVEFNRTKHNSLEISRFKIKQEKEKWEKLIELAESGALKWTDTELAIAKANLKKLDNEYTTFLERVGEAGIGTTLLESMGFDDEQIDALKEAANTVIDQFSAILDAEVELAEKEVELAEQRVEATQNAYDAEIEARNNGYANSVETAKKELEQEKKNQKEKEKLLAAAQKRQERLNSITQASSLITASANLWSAFSTIPAVGPALALAAIATMWGSFAAAKAKAKQVSAVQEYGEGGLEFLEGGSHVSGNDIDLGIKNRNNKRMKVEGGEALAVIKKSQAKKYRAILPGIVESLNKGIFEDKYLNAFSSPEQTRIFLEQPNSMDLSRIEKDLSYIRARKDIKTYALPDGGVVIEKGNVKRIIRH